MDSLAQDTLLGDRYRLSRRIAVGGMGEVWRAEDTVLVRTVAVKVLKTEFTSDRTSSNKAGVTLMNNQVGYVVADVMRDKQDITITELPSMIRVDGVNKIEFEYEEIADALGWADFGNDDFEEIMSTHYGRMVVLDDRVVFFANPEDAAEYIGFDLQPVT